MTESRARRWPSRRFGADDAAAVERRSAATTGPCFAAMRWPTAWPGARCPTSWKCSGSSRPRSTASKPRRRSSTAWSIVGCLDGELLCPVDLADGKKKWKFHTELGFNASPRCATAACTSATPTASSTVFDAATGKPMWGSEADGEIDSGANFYKDNVLFGSQDAHALLPRRGRPASWPGSTRSTTRSAARPPSSRTARSWPAATASCTSSTWTKAKPIGHGRDRRPDRRRRPRSRGDRVYFGTEGASFFCHRLARRPRSPGRIEVGRATCRFARRPRSRPRRVIFGGRDKLVHALDPTDGHELWKYSTRSARRFLAGDRRLRASSSARPTAGCMASIARRARKSGSTKPAANSRLRPPWPTAGW